MALARHCPHAPEWAKPASYWLSPPELDSCYPLNSLLATIVKLTVNSEAQRRIPRLIRRHGRWRPSQGCGAQQLAWCLGEERNRQGSRNATQKGHCTLRKLADNRWCKQPERTLSETISSGLAGMHLLLQAKQLPPLARPASMLQARVTLLHGQGAKSARCRPGLRARAGVPAGRATLGVRRSWPGEVGQLAAECQNRLASRTLSLLLSPMACSTAERTICTSRPRRSSASASRCDSTE